MELRNCDVINFWTVWLKNAYSRPPNWNFGDLTFYPLSGESIININKIPKV